MADLKDQLRNPNYANSSSFARTYMTKAADHIAALETQLEALRQENFRLIRDNASYVEASAELAMENEKLKEQLAEAKARVAELEKALDSIKAKVCGDAYPYWTSSENVTSSRMWIADVCDAARRVREGEKV